MVLIFLSSFPNSSPILDVRGVAYFHAYLGFVPLAYVSSFTLSKYVYVYYINRYVLYKLSSSFIGD